MKHILLLLLSFFVPVVWGQQVEQFKLWPDKPEAGEAEIFVYHPAKGGKAAPAVQAYIWQLHSVRLQQMPTGRTLQSFIIR